MKRTLKDTNRTVVITIDNRDREELWASGEVQIWTSIATIDGEIWPGEAEFGITPDKAFARMAEALDKSGDLDDLPIPVPERDYELLCSLLRGIASTWDQPADVPDWRTNDYLRGQLELVIETCRVLTDKEYDEGSGVDGEVLRDRITTWITSEAWK